jgi:glutathione S-transferase
MVQVHNTHHPIDMMAYYEDYKDEAAKYTAGFRKDRLPKFLQHFERHLRDDGWLYSTGPTYVDLALWVLISGLKFAFPNALERHKKDSPKLIEHWQLVQSSPRLQACKSPSTSAPSNAHRADCDCDAAADFRSDRHLEFSNGIFRHYDELDPVDE